MSLQRHPTSAQAIPITLPRRPLIKSSSAMCTRSKVAPIRKPDDISIEGAEKDQDSDQPAPPAHSQPPTLPHSLTLPQPRTRRDLMRESIRHLQRSEWVSLEGLVEVATEQLCKEECTAISELGRGSHNSLYSLTFSDGTTCAASISNSPPAFFSAAAKASEVATMRYIASSPLYSSIPIPRIFAADHTFTNPVHAPYILRSVVTGRNLSEDGYFYSLPSESKQRVIAALARIQAALSVPSEFTELGCIYHTEERGFHVGPAIPPPGAESTAFCGPYRNLPEVWAARLDREAHAAATTLTTLATPHLPGTTGTPALLGEMLQLLSGLAPLFTPPAALSHPVLHHSDLALRNVLFDPTTLEVTGVIDWEFAQITPLVLTGRFPNDLGWEGNEFARSLGKMPGVAAGETWNHHYYDFTSLQGVSHASLPSPPASPVHAGDYLSHPAQSTPSPPSPPLPPPPDAATNPADVKRRAEMLVELFYWRKYYAACLGRERWDCTRLCMDAVAYVKFNEVVMGGVERWVECKDWVREVYWRLEGVGAEAREGLRGGMGVVRVPEVFKKRMRPADKAKRPMVVDLAD